MMKRTYFLPDTLERCFDEVPLDADEAREAERETGINTARLAERIRARVSCPCAGTGVISSAPDFEGNTPLDEACARHAR